MQRESQDYGMITPANACGRLEEAHGFNDTACLVSATRKALREIIDMTQQYGQDTCSTSDAEGCTTTDCDYDEIDRSESFADWHFTMNPTTCKEMFPCRYARMGCIYYVRKPNGLCWRCRVK